ncbi:hypothetical protein PtA15_8A289 [Puccinia triticina]|nr:uncharacterized protein PtA15_8A289 [Puccinia triticina]WAQ87385.1 hypothetical protein PtA15_8A289 [Puccinia triticina]
MKLIKFVKVCQGQLLSARKPVRVPLEIEESEDNILGRCAVQLSRREPSSLQSTFPEKNPDNQDNQCSLDTIIMSSGKLSIDGVKSSAIIEAVSLGISKMTEAEKKKQMKAINGIFQMNVKSAEGKEGTWTIDFKKEGKVYQGPAKPKADVTINLSDETFQALADGKLNGQKAFMGGQLKVKGNIMLATKLDVLLKSAQAKL